MWRVTIPLIMPSILAGALLVFLLTLKELPLTMVLAPLNFDSLSLKVWGFASEAFFAKAALPSIMIILLSGPAAAYLVFKRNELDIRG
jgi:iron(III) transport system permease protein